MNPENEPDQDIPRPASVLSAMYVGSKLLINSPDIPGETKTSLTKLSSYIRDVFESMSNKLGLSAQVNGTVEVSTTELDILNSNIDPLLVHELINISKPMIVDPDDYLKAIVFLGNLVLLTERWAEHTGVYYGNDIFRSDEDS